MVCPDPDVLTRFLNEETRADEADRVSSHVGVCAECRERVDTERALDRALAFLPSLDPRATPPGPCLDTPALAAFVDRTLPESDRARAEEHLARCGSCLDDLVAATSQAGFAGRTVPAGLAAQAAAVGQPVVRRAAALPRSAGWRQPTWRWAAAFGGVLLAGALVWSPGSAPTPKNIEGPSEPRGGAFGRRPLSSVRAGVVAGGIVTVDAELAGALRRYDESPGPETRSALLQALERGSLKIPSGRVTTIEIRESVLAHLGTEPPAEARVTLLEGGLLVVEEP